MRGDVERTQKEIQRAFDLAVHDSSFKLDRDTINDIRHVLESGELYLKKKHDQEHLAIALRADPRVKALKNRKEQKEQAIESYMPVEDNFKTPYQRFQRNNKSLDILRNDREESLSQQVSGNRSRVDVLPSLQPRSSGGEDGERRSYKFSSSNNRIPLRENRNLKGKIAPRVVKLPPIFTTKLL